MFVQLRKGRILNIMKDMKQQNTVNLGSFDLSNQCESAQSVMKKHSIKTTKLCETNPIFQKVKCL
jgi:choline kinase